MFGFLFLAPYARTTRYEEAFFPLENQGKKARFARAPHYKKCVPACSIRFYYQYTKVQSVEVAQRHVVLVERTTPQHHALLIPVPTRRGTFSTSIAACRTWSIPLCRKRLGCGKLQQQ